jgi:hypothetical protein
MAGIKIKLNDEKPIVNSVTATGSFLYEIQPLFKECGTVIIGLTRNYTITSLI